jgi:hypothetical protein
MYALGKNAPDLGDVKAWALLMLIVIGIGIVLTILVHIIAHILLAIGISVREGADDETVDRIVSVSTVEDERDRLINLKSSRIGYAIAGLGSMGMLAALVMDASFVLALHILFGSFFIGSLIEGMASVYFYEVGA